MASGCESPWAKTSTQPRHPYAEPWDAPSFILHREGVTPRSHPKAALAHAGTAETELAESQRRQALMSARHQHQAERVLQYAIDRPTYERNVRHEMKAALDQQEVDRSVRTSMQRQAFCQPGYS